MPLHRFIHIHRCQARHIEARQPHIHHDSNLHGAVVVFEQLRIFFVCAVVDDLVPFLFVLIAGAGHHVYLLRPFRTHLQQTLVDLERRQFVVGNNHRLSRQLILAVLLIVFYDIITQAADGLVAAQQSFDAAVVVLGLVDLLCRTIILCQLVESFVQLPQFIFVQIQVDDAALVIDRPCSTVGYRLCHIIDIDVVAEHLLCIAVAVGYRGSRESHEHGIGQCLAHQPCKTFLHPLRPLVPVFITIL